MGPVAEGQRQVAAKSWLPSAIGNCSSHQKSAQSLGHSTTPLLHICCSTHISSGADPLVRGRPPGRPFLNGRILILLAGSVRCGRADYNKSAPLLMQNPVTALSESYTLQFSYIVYKASFLYRISNVHCRPAKKRACKQYFSFIFNPNHGTVLRLPGSDLTVLFPA
jgi:hypothetical protein